MRREAVVRRQRLQASLSKTHSPYGIRDHITAELLPPDGFTEQHTVDAEVTLRAADGREFKFQSSLRVRPRSRMPNGEDIILFGQQYLINHFDARIQPRRLMSPATIRRRPPSFWGDLVLYAYLNPFLDPDDSERVTRF